MIKQSLLCVKRNLIQKSPQEILVIQKLTRIKKKPQDFIKLEIFTSTSQVYRYSIDFYMGFLLGAVKVEVEASQMSNISLFGKLNEQHSRSWKTALLFSTGLSNGWEGNRRLSGWLADPFNNLQN